MSKAYKDYLGGSLNPKKAITKIKYDIEFMREHPTYFKPDGFICFEGIQGGGKTSSAVEYVHRLALEYPKAWICTNIHINFPDWDGKIIPYVDYKQIENLDNGYDGIILLLDEIQILFNSLESAKIDPSWFTIISQQRKRRLHVVGTAQNFSRIAKCWREQATACICCKQYFGIIQYRGVVDLQKVETDENGEVTKFPVTDAYWSFVDSAIFGYYDTWQKIGRKESGKHVNSRRKPDVGISNSVVCTDSTVN